MSTPPPNFPSPFNTSSTNNSEKPQKEALKQNLKWKEIDLQQEKNRYHEVEHQVQPNQKNSNYHPMDREQTGYKPYMSPKDQETNSQKYTQLRTSYQDVTRKEQTIQATGTIFSMISVGIEIVAYQIISRLLDRHIPLEIILRYFMIFIILAVIGILAIIQLQIIHQWNRSVSGLKKSLTQSNYQIINRMRIIQALIVLILLLCGLFIYLFNQARLPTNVNQILRLFKIFMVLRQFAYATIISFGLLEGWQLFRWTRRINTVERMELKILDDFPDFGELLKLVEGD